MTSREASMAEIGGHLACFVQKVVAQVAVRGWCLVGRKRPTGKNANGPRAVLPRARTAVVAGHAGLRSSGWGSPSSHRVYASRRWISPSILRAIQRRLAHTRSEE